MLMVMWLTERSSNWFCNEEDTPDYIVSILYYEHVFNFLYLLFKKEHLHFPNVMQTFP